MDCGEFTDFFPEVSRQREFWERNIFLGRRGSVTAPALLGAGFAFLPGPIWDELERRENPHKLIPKPPDLAMEAKLCFQEIFPLNPWMR